MSLSQSIGVNGTESSENLNEVVNDLIQKLGNISIHRENVLTNKLNGTISFDGYAIDTDVKNNILTIKRFQNNPLIEIDFSWDDSKVAITDQYYNTYTYWLDPNAENMRLWRYNSMGTWGINNNNFEWAPIANENKKVAVNLFNQNIEHIIFVLGKFLSASQIEELQKNSHIQNLA